jgi:uncharacterized protein involved in exopolysaccharide biosynthesis
MISRTPGELSLMKVALILLHRRRVVLGVPLVLAALVVVITLLWPRRFTVDASFLPQSGGAALSGAATLAAKFGVALPTDDPSQSPAFYGQLLGSDEILRQVVTQRYKVGTDTISRTLVDLLDVDDDTEELRIEDAILRMNKKVHISLQPETGVVELEVTTDWPEVSFQAATQMLDLVNQFNRAEMHERASAERQFMQERVQEASLELRNAEDALDQFLITNRQYQGAPNLVLQHDRLERAVTMRQDVYTSLMQALDNSRLDEARNTPLITVVEPARLPARPDRRHIGLKGLLALVVGFIFGVVWAMAQSAWDDAAALNPEVSLHVAEARVSMIRQMRRLGRLKAPPVEHADSSDV